MSPPPPPPPMLHSLTIGGCRYIDGPLDLYWSHELWRAVMRAIPPFTGRSRGAFAILIEQELLRTKPISAATRSRVEKRGWVLASDRYVPMPKRGLQRILGAMCAVLAAQRIGGS